MVKKKSEEVEVVENKETEKAFKSLKNFGLAQLNSYTRNTEVISINSHSLNWAVGNNGIIEGSKVLFYGPEQSGKSTVIDLSVIALLNKYNTPNDIAIKFDTEFATIGSDFYEKLGGDPTRYLVKPTNDPLDIFDWTKSELPKLFESGINVRAIVIDSIRGISFPKDIKEKTTDANRMGGTGASYLPGAFKLILPVLYKYKTTLFMVQQVQEEMDQYKKARWPWILPDGRSLKHNSDYMIQVERIESKESLQKDDKESFGTEVVSGHKIKAKIKKNRTAAPFRTAMFTLDFNKGIVGQGEELFELAKGLGVIHHPYDSKTGEIAIQMWEYGNNQPIRGEENMKQWVLSNPDKHDEIYKACCSATNEAIEKHNDSIPVSEVMVGDEK